MSVLVWVEGWEMECCGTPFAVGDDVEWTARPTVDRRWLEDELGKDLAATVDHAESHHDIGDGVELVRLVGVVREIHSVQRHWEAVDTPRGTTRRPASGTAVLESVQAVHRSAMVDTDALCFDGYLMALDVTGRASTH